MSLATTCMHSGDVIDVAAALTLKQSAQRENRPPPQFACTFCGDAVGPWGGASPHIEHADRNPRCPLSHVARLASSVVTTRKEPEAWRSAFEVLLPLLEQSASGKYLKLYPQAKNQMLFYAPGMGSYPLHIIDPARLDRVDVFDALDGIITRQAPKADSAGFLRYDVLNWHAFLVVINSFVELAAVDARKLESTAGTLVSIGLNDAVQRMIDVACVTAAASGKQVIRVTKSKQLVFLTAEIFRAYLDQLIQDQGRRCALTGLELSFDVNAADKSRLCSLDRIDSNGHYVDGNLQVVCRFVNRWKGSQDDHEFRRLLRLVQGDLAPDVEPKRKAQC